MQYRSRSTSLTAEVQRLKAAEPELWLPTSYVSDAILMVQHSKELDYNPKMVLAQDSGHVESAFVEQVGKDAQGYASRAVFVPDLANRKPVIKQVNELFKARVNHDMADVPARVFTGFLVLCDAINRAASVDAERIRQALVATDVPGDQIPMPWQGVISTRPRARTSRAPRSSSDCRAVNTGRSGRSTSRPRSSSTPSRSGPSGAEAGRCHPAAT